MKTRSFIILICVEVIYTVLSTIISITMGGDLVLSEVCRTIPRIITLIIYAIVFSKETKSKTMGKMIVKDKVLMVSSIIVIMLYPLLFMKSRDASLVKVIWFLTSFIVGFREEIFYRGFIQKKLGNRMGKIPAIIMTSLIFTCYHVVYFYWGLWPSLLEVFLWSIFIGIIYCVTKNIILVSIIHGAYDAVPFITPFDRVGLSYVSGLLILIISIILLMPIYGRVRKVAEPQGKQDMRQAEGE